MKRSFRGELFISLIAVALITLVISGSILISAVRNKMEWDYERDSMERIAFVEAEMDKLISDIGGTVDDITGSSKIVGSIYETDSWLLKKAYTALYEITDKERNKAIFSIYDAQGRCIFTTQTVNEAQDLPVYWGILKIAGTHRDELIMRNASGSVNNSDAALEFAKAIIDRDEVIGYVLVSVTRDNIVGLLDNLYAYDSDVVVLDEFWEEIYSSDLANRDGIAEMLRKRRIEGQDISQSGDGFMFCIKKMQNEDIYIVVGKRSAFTDELTNTMLSILLLLAAVTLLLCLVIAKCLSDYLTKPIDSMYDAMSKVRQGDFNVQIGSTRQDELGQLARDFDDMTHALKMYIDLRTKQQQELNDSNVAMMQAQLNPHFLYNTLDTIKWVAKANHVPELAVLSSSLAKLLRASISGDTFVTLAKEIDLVTYYTDIQKIRFSDSFTFDAEVPMELEDAIVPKLILQPIVENAIVHGLKEKNEGAIFLNAYESDGRIVIDIEDNGCGMDEEMLDALNSHDRERLVGHIGFYNVDTIIRINYGLRYGLKAANLPDGGVRVTLELPLKFS